MNPSSTNGVVGELTSTKTGFESKKIGVVEMSSPLPGTESPLAESVKFFGLARALSIRILEKSRLGAVVGTNLEKSSSSTIGVVVIVFAVVVVVVVVVVVAGVEANSAEKSELTWEVS